MSVYKRFYTEYPNVKIDKSLIDSIDESTMWINPQNGGEGLSKIKLLYVNNPLKMNRVKTPETAEELIWSNQNIIAQEGLFLLYNNGDIPLEKFFFSKFKQNILPKIFCLDIHKSLIDYIKNKYLKDISSKNIYPNMYDIVKNIYYNVLANL